MEINGKIEKTNNKEICKEIVKEICNKNGKKSFKQSMEKIEKQWDKMYIPVRNLEHLLHKNPWLRW